MRFPAIGLVAALAIAAPAFAQVLPAPSEAPQSQSIDVDTDNDGEVTYLEYIEPMLKLFQQLDKDNSGALSKDELGERDLVLKAPEPAQR